MNVKKYLLIIVLGCFGMVIVLNFKLVDKLEAMVLNQIEPLFLLSKIRLYPKEYVQKLKVYKEEETDDYSLYKITYRYSSSYLDGFVLEDDKNDDIKFIKFPILENSILRELNRKYEGGDKINYYQYYISLNAFNRYCNLKYKNQNTRAKIIDEYIMFLSGGNYYASVDSEKDLNKLLEERQINRSMLSIQTLDKSQVLSIIQQKRLDNTFIFWLEDKGLLKLIFSFNQENSLDNVGIETIGFLGNEFLKI